MSKGHTQFLNIINMEKNNAFLQVHIERPVYEQETLNEDCHYEKPKPLGM